MAHCYLIYSDVSQIPSGSVFIRRKHNQPRNNKQRIRQQGTQQLDIMLLYNVRNMDTVAKNIES